MLGGEESEVVSTVGCPLKSIGRQPAFCAIAQGRINECGYEFSVVDSVKSFRMVMSSTQSPEGLAPLGIMGAKLIDPLNVTVNWYRDVQGDPTIRSL